VEEISADKKGGQSRDKAYKKASQKEIILRGLIKRYFPY
jgi:hypothetical protein